MKLKALTTTNKLKINNETKIHTHTQILTIWKVNTFHSFPFPVVKNSHNFKSFTAEPMVYIFSRAQKKCTEFFIYVNTQKKTKIDK